VLKLKVRDPGHFSAHHLSHKIIGRLSPQHNINERKKAKALDNLMWKKVYLWLHAHATPLYN
jgi:hypothetical protein